MLRSAVRSKEQIITYEGPVGAPAAYRGHSSRRRAAASPPRRGCSWREHAGHINRAHTDRWATRSTGRHREVSEAVGVDRGRYLVHRGDQVQPLPGRASRPCPQRRPQPPQGSRGGRRASQTPRHHLRELLRRRSVVHKHRKHHLQAQRDISQGHADDKDLTRWAVGGRVILSTCALRSLWSAWPRPPRSCQRRRLLHTFATCGFDPHTSLVLVQDRPSS